MYTHMTNRSDCNTASGMSHWAWYSAERCHETSGPWLDWVQDTAVRSPYMDIRFAIWALHHIAQTYCWHVEGRSALRGIYARIWAATIRSCSRILCLDKNLRLKRAMEQIGHLQDLLTCLAEAAPTECIALPSQQVSRQQNICSCLFTACGRCLSTAYWHTHT